MRIEKLAPRKNWAESDRIRDELDAMGIALKDNKDGTTSLGAEAMNASAFPKPSLRPYLPADLPLLTEIRLCRHRGIDR